MNIYITGHGCMDEDEGIPAIATNFYVEASGDLTADDIPAIVDGTTASIENQTDSEHYIYGTKIDTDINEYLITDFDNEGGIFTITAGRQSLKEYTNEDGDINVFPISSDEKDDDINNVKRIIGVGNKLSSIIGHYRNKYKGKPLTFHWVACRKYIFPALV